MTRSCTCSMNKAGLLRPAFAGLAMTVACLAVSSGTAAAFAAEKDRDPVVLRVITVNPSADKTQAVPVRIDLPAEVAPKDILDKGSLEVEFDEDRGIYYVTNKTKIELAPKETRVFEVIVKDLWFVPEKKINDLRSYTGVLMKRLEKTEYADTAKQAADSIYSRLDLIVLEQADDSIGRKVRIGNYRRHTAMLDEIREDLSRMEKLLTFTGGPPVPEMLEESKLKSDAPSRTTTWLVIFLILFFLGLLGGQFFFTWHRRTRIATDSAAIRDAAYSILQARKEPGSSTTTSTDVPGGTSKSPSPGRTAGPPGSGRAGF